MEFTAGQIAQMAGGAVEGNPEARVSTVAKIEEGTPGSITFLANPKYTHYIYTTKASVVLVADTFVPEQPVEATLIRVKDPYATVTHLLEMVSKMMQPQHVGVEQPCHIAEGVEVPGDAYVGAFAYVAKGVRLGRGVKIFPGCYVGENVTIGDGTVLNAGVKVYYGCSIGAGCIIHAGAVIGADGFGFAPLPDGSYEKIPQTGTVTIEDDVEIGANTTVDRATMGTTRIHRGVKLDNLIMVAHNVEIGANTVMASQCGIAGSTKVGSHCMMGGQVGLAGHITIGDNVNIGAQSGIHNNVKEGSTILGSPAVDARMFMRQSARIKHLDDIWDRVAALEKKTKNL